MLRRRAHYLLLPFALLALLVAACGGDDDGNGDGGGNGTSTASPADSASPVDTDGADRPVDPFSPPLEGPGRGDPPSELTDFREEPDWQLPEPGNVPEPEGNEDPVLNPPKEPVCPEDWERLRRPSEGFEICYPGGWAIDGHGYVNSQNEERWYSVGVFNAPDVEAGQQLAHVSVYVIPQFSRPFRYTIDCPQPYATTLSGEPAVVCPEFPPLHPEASIVSYHVFREDFDYFVNIATYYEWNENDGEYTDEVNEEAAAMAIQIAHSFEFIPVARVD